MKKTIIKRVGKSFRLVDFHIFNRKGELFKNDDSMSEDSDDQAKWNEQENFIRKSQYKRFIINHNDNN